MTTPVIAYGHSDRLWQAIEVSQEFFETFVYKLRFLVYGRVQFIDIRLMVFAVVQLHNIFTNVFAKCVVLIIEIG
jgi:hypothetical protein